MMIKSGGARRGSREKLTLLDRWLTVQACCHSSVGTFGMRYLTQYLTLMSMTYGLIWNTLETLESHRLGGHPFLMSQARGPPI